MMNWLQHNAVGRTALSDKGNHSMNTFSKLSIVAICAFTVSAYAAESDSGTTSAAGLHTAEQTKNLATFDDLDFRVYSNQDWDGFSKSHAENILVHYPDGSTTEGLPDHIVKLKPQFTFAPDTHIDEHPIKLADGNYTAVQGILKGTFTKPMDLGNGKVLQPTGKSFELPMFTVARWENGLMVEEWLYWDNAAFMAQITKP